MHTFNVSITTVQGLKNVSNEADMMIYGVIKPISTKAEGLITP
jgi:hypothetical protein